MILTLTILQECFNIFFDFMFLFLHEFIFKKENLINLRLLPSTNFEILSSVSWRAYMLALYWALLLWKPSLNPASDNSTSSEGLFPRRGRTCAGLFLHAITQATATIPTMRRTAAAVSPTNITVKLCFGEGFPAGSGIVVVSKEPQQIGH